MGRVEDHLRPTSTSAICRGGVPVAVSAGNSRKASAPHQSSAGSLLDFIGDGTCLDWKPGRANLKRPAARSGNSARSECGRDFFELVVQLEGLVPNRAPVPAACPGFGCGELEGVMDDGKLAQLFIPTAYRRLAKPDWSDLAEERQATKQSLWPEFCTRVYIQISGDLTGDPREHAGGHTNPALG